MQMDDLDAIYANAPAGWDGNGCLHSEYGCRPCRATWMYCHNGCGRTLDWDGQRFCSGQCESEHYDPSRKGR